MPSKARRTSREVFIKNVLLIALTVILLGAAAQVAWNSNLLDFTVYYGAGRQLLAAASPYDVYGPYQLPFWYVPWVAWLFAPLSVLPLRAAWLGFLAINSLLLAIVFRLLFRLYRVSLPIPVAGLLYALTLIMSLLLVHVGQVSIIQLTAVVLMIVAISRRRLCVAGIAFPLMLLKPQLIILMAPALWLAGGRKALLASLASLAAVAMLATIITPAWPREVVAAIVTGQQRNDPLKWNYTTLPALLGLGRQWNYFFAAAMLPGAAWITCRLRRILQRDEWLAVVLALSLLVAPQSFAYDLPLLLPALIWLTGRWSWRGAALWFAAATIPLLAQYSSAAYLDSVMVVGIALWRAHCRLQATPAPAKM
ncbi:MAG: glycosyltransferase family 87 protein [Chloroflexi bacterium]|nr:glycosyltransferase family 87 protein [Chloroflexota bacterium]